MTDNEIIKALERLSAEDPDGFSAVVLEMVNRQKAKIEKLEKTRQKQGQLLSEERKQKYDLIEKLSQVRIAAYKDFADMVRDTFFYDISDSKPKGAKFPCALMYAIEKEIEKALKEMVGEDE